MEKNEPDRRLPTWFRTKPTVLGALFEPADSRRLIVGVLVVAGAVVGCDSSSSPADEALTAEEVAARYGYDMSTATLSPVYALVPEYRDPLDGYARDLLARECLQGVFEYPAVPPGSDPTLIDDERTGQRLFNEEVAQQWGYPQFRLPSSRNVAVGEDVEITSAIDDAMVQCGERTGRRLGSPPERVFADIESAGWESVSTSAEVQAAIVGWRTCMAPAGVVDLPDGPDGMPPASVVSPPEDAQGNETDTGIIPLSDREREVAVADARCRAEVGYDGAVLRARAEAELAAIGRDVEGFEAGRRAYEEYQKKIDEVITELG